MKYEDILDMYQIIRDSFKLKGFYFINTSTLSNIHACE